jgi:hypothetical protein
MSDLYDRYAVRFTHVTDAADRSDTRDRIERARIRYARRAGAVVRTRRSDRGVSAVTVLCVVAGMFLSFLTGTAFALEQMRKNPIAFAQTEDSDITPAETPGGTRLRYDGVTNAWYLR